MAGQGNENLPKKRRTRTSAKKRGNPRRGFPLRPPPALMRAQESSALCGARARALPLHPAAFEKAGETFKRAMRPKTRTRPSPKSGEERPAHRGRSAHADGGAAGVKKRFSLAARHRFFGQAPKKWGRIAAGATIHLPTYRRTRTTRRKGGTPGEGSPLDPLLRSNKHKGVPPAAAGGQRLCLWTSPPLKRRAKLLFVWDHCFFWSLCLLPFSSTI